MNESNFLGSGGKLAEAYAELMERMWRGKMTAFPPTHFKQVLLHNLMVVLPITTCYYLLLPLMLHDCYFYCYRSSRPMHRVSAATSSRMRRHRDSITTRVMYA